MAVALAGAAAAAAAEDLPAFRKGVWEFVRTVEGGGKPQTITRKECVSPTEDMRRQNAMLAKAGCTLSPVAKTGASYAFTAQCRMQGVSMQSKSVITAEGDGAYRVEVESLQGGSTSKELLVARRVGDC